MASTVTSREHTGDGSDKTWAYTFQSYQQEDIKVAVTTAAGLFKNVTNFTIPDYSASSGTVTFNSTGVDSDVCESDGSPKTGRTIRIFRETDITSGSVGEYDPKATYTAGSAVKAGDLNNNAKQALYAAFEQRDQEIQRADIRNDSIDGTKIADNAIDSEHYVDGSIDLAHMSANSVDSDQYVDGSIDLAHMSANSVDSAQYVDGSIDLVHMSANSVDSNQYVDGSIDTAHIANLQITTAKIADAAVTNDKILNRTIANNKLVENSITASELAANSVTSSELADNAVDTDAIVADAVTGAKVEDNAIDSEHIAAGAVDLEHMSANSVDSNQYVDQSIEAAHLAPNSVTNTKIANDAITTTKILDGQVDAAKLNQTSGAQAVITAAIRDANVTTAKIAPDAVTGAQLDDNAVDSEHYVDGSIDRSHIADDAVNGSKLANDIDIAGTLDVTGVSTFDDDVNISSADITFRVKNGSTDKFTVASASGNTVVKGSLTVEGTTTLPNNSITVSNIADSELSTLASMQSGTASLLAGGTALTATLAEINTIVDGKAVHTTISDSDAHYPTSGAVVDYVAAQIAPIGGLEVIATDAAFPNTQPSSGVVISIADAGGLVVNGSGTSTTGRTVGGSTVTINGINSSYNSSTVTAGIGFLVTSTGSGQIYNFHKSVIRDQDILSISTDIDDFANRYRVGSSNPSSNNDAGDLFYNTGTNKLYTYDADAGTWNEAQSQGNHYISTLSPAFNGSLTNFTLANAPSSAAQVILAINGVIQKPNAGTSNPSEGFALDGATVKLGAAPPTGSTYSAVVIGSSVNTGTPSDNTVSTAKLQNVAVTTAKIAADAVDGTKIADDAVGAEHIEQLDNTLSFADNVNASFGTGGDLLIDHNGTDSFIDNNTGDLYIQTTGSGDDISIQSADDFTVQVAGTEIAIQAFGDAGVKLWYDNVKKFETTSNGINVTGRLLASGDAGYGIILEDSVKIGLGTAKDLQIYHDGNNSWIKDAGTGALVLANSSGGVQNAAATENIIWWAENGDVELFYDNSKKFETTSYGSASAGQLRVTSSNATTVGFSCGDAGTGFYNSGSNAIGYSANGTQKWNINGSGELILLDSVKAKFGTGEDLQLYHDGSHSYIANTTGNLYITEDGYIELSSANGGEKYATFNKDGAVNLYYNGVETFRTAQHGVIVTAGEGQNTELFFYADEGDDNADKWKFVAFTNPASTFDLYNLTSGSWEKNISCVGNGQVELYYDNSKKFETTSSGATVTGNLGIGTTSPDAPLTIHNSSDPEIRLGYSSSQDHRIGWDSSKLHIHADPDNANANSGLYFYVDNTERINIDSGGKTTFNGDGEWGDNKRIRIGSDGDMQIWHDGSNNKISTWTGSISLESAGESMLDCHRNGSVDLFYDNSKKFETNSTGAFCTGQLGCDTLYMGDDDKAKFGNNDDLQMWHNGSHSYIANTTGGIHISTNNGDAWIQSDANVYLGDVNGNEIFVKCVDNGTVQLSHNNTIKFSTTSWGVQPSGDVVPNGDNSYDLGSSIERWDNVYATNGTIQTSDRNEKNTIVSSDLGLSFVNKLKPVSYKFNNKTRTHYGLIAQDVETTLSDISKSTANFAGFIKTDNSATLYADWDELPDGKNIGDVRIAAKTTYGLRYNEFIAPLIKAVQELSAEVDTLKTKVAALEAK